MSRYVSRPEIRETRRVDLCATRLAAAESPFDRVVAYTDYLKSIVKDRGLTDAEKCSLLDDLTRPIQERLSRGAIS